MNIGFRIKAGGKAASAGGALKANYTMGDSREKQEQKSVWFSMMEVKWP